MIEQEDALMRPVLRGMVRYESLLDCSVDLADLMVCNEAIDIEQENDRRAARHEAQKRKEAGRGK